MGNRMDNLTADERNELIINNIPITMSEENPIYNDKPVKVWSPVYALPITGYVILRKGFIWRNKLFTSFDQALINLRFAYPNDRITVHGQIVNRFRNGNYEIIPVRLENGERY